MQLDLNNTLRAIFGVTVLRVLTIFQLLINHVNPPSKIVFKKSESHYPSLYLVSGIYSTLNTRHSYQHLEKVLFIATEHILKLRI